MMSKIDEAFGEEIMAAYWEDPKASILGLWEKLGKGREISYNCFLNYINGKLYIMIENARKGREEALKTAIKEIGVPKRVVIDNGRAYRGIDNGKASVE